jgi:hypothetical protein
MDGTFGRCALKLGDGGARLLTCADVGAEQDHPGSFARTNPVE